MSRRAGAKKVRFNPNKDQGSKRARAGAKAARAHNRSLRSALAGR